MFDQEADRNRRVFANEDGATAIEYGLIAAVISVAALFALQTVGQQITGSFGAVKQALGPSQVATPLNETEKRRQSGTTNR